MADLTKGYSFGATETVTNAKLHSLIDDGTCTGIVKADVATGAAIDASKITGIVGTSTTQTWTGTNTFSSDFVVTGDVFLGTANKGDIWYDDGTKMTRLVPGTDGYYLKTQGAGKIPVWTEVTSSGVMVQVVNVMDGAVDTGTTTIPNDDTIPQITEGDEYMTLAVTPTSATNMLKIDVVFNYSINNVASNNSDCVALFQDTTAGALAAVQSYSNATAEKHTIGFTHYMTAGTTSATTFRVRAGTNHAGTITFNGSGGARKLGGVMASSITITEISV